MARQLRIEYKGAIYHVTVRGNDRRDIFLDDEDRKYFLSRLSDCIDLCGVRLYLFCLMSNHFHLVFETPQANLSRFMQRVLTGFTVYFNCRHQRSGHVTQGRYKARVVEGDRYLQKLSRYVHLNPVKTKGMEDLGRKEKIERLHGYTWSSYRSYIGEAKEYPFVEYGPMLSLMGDRKKSVQQRSYRRFVEEMAGETDEEFQGELCRSPLSIGSEKFRERIDESYRILVKRRKQKEDVSFRKEGRSELLADEVLGEVVKRLKIDKADLTRRRRDSSYRGIASLMLCKHCGYSQREVAGILGLRTGAAVSYQMNRAKVGLRENKSLARTVDRIDRALSRMRKK